jgi:hypothetical protein
VSWKKLKEKVKVYPEKHTFHYRPQTSNMAEQKTTRPTNNNTNTANRKTKIAQATT